MKPSRFLVIILLSLVLAHELEGQKKSRKRQKASKRGSLTRQRIIKCCGKVSCFQDLHVKNRSQNSSTTKKSYNGRGSTSRSKSVPTVYGAATAGGVEKETQPAPATGQGGDEGNTDAGESILVTSLSPENTGPPESGPSATSASSDQQSQEPNIVDKVGTMSTVPSSQVTSAGGSTYLQPVPTSNPANPTTQTSSVGSISVTDSTVAQSTTTTPAATTTTGVPTTTSTLPAGKYLKMTLGQDLPEGKFMKSCGRKYFFSSVKLNLNIAKMFCCSMKMRLLSMANYDQHVCLASANVALKLSGALHWTTGFKDAECNRWCSNSGDTLTIDSSIPWLQNSPANPTVDRCVGFELNTGPASASGLKYVDCSQSNFFICESTETTCPDANALAKNTSLFSSGNLKSPSTYGTWFEASNALFLFGNSLLNWRQNWETCARIGMRPLYLLDSNEVNSFNSVFKSWKLNFNYWTAATRQDFPLSPKGFWCPNREQVNIDWAFASAQNTSLAGVADCVALNVGKSKSATTTSFFGTLVYRNCSQRQMLACRGPPTQKPCTMPTCPVEYERNLTLFNQRTGQLDYAGNYGKWVQKCGRIFVFSHIYVTNQYNFTWEEARDRCEKIGFKMLSLDTPAKFDCLKETFEENPHLARTHWTSATFLDCDDKQKFSWCAQDADVEDAKMTWGQGHPPADKVGKCLSMVLAPSRAPYLEAVSCDSRFSYVCEAEDTKGESFAKFKSSMCQTTFNVTEAEIDGVLTAPSFSLNLKCYFKCMGDSLKLFSKDGTPVDNSVYKLIESAVGSDDAATLSNSFDVIDNCKGSNKGLSGCDAIASPFKCTVEQMPEVVEKMVMDQKTDTSGGAPVTCIKATCFNPTCTLDPAIVAQVNTNTAPAGIAYIFDACGRKFAVSSEQLDTNSAAAKCCQLNMSLAYFESKEDYHCFQAFDSGLGNNKPGVEWAIGGTNLGCAPMFSWCPSQKPIENFPWVHKGDYNDATFRCVIILRGGTSTSFDADGRLWESPCSGLPNYYVCST